MKIQDLYVTNYGVKIYQFMDSLNVVKQQTFRQNE